MIDCGRKAYYVNGGLAKGPFDVLLVIAVGPPCQRNTSGTGTVPHKTSMPAHG